MLDRPSRQFVPFLVIALFMMGGAFASAPSMSFDDQTVVWEAGAGGFDTVKEALDIASNGNIIKLGPAKGNNKTNFEFSVTFTDSDVAKYKTESTPGALATGVLLALAAVALVVSIRRRRW